MVNHTQLREFSPVTWIPCSRLTRKISVSIRFIIVLYLSLSAFPAKAKKLYSYQDKNGTWNFTDSPPNTDQPVEVEQIKVRKRSAKVTLEKKGTKQAPIIFAKNRYYAPVELKITLVQGENFLSSPLFPARTLLPAQAHQEVLRFKGKDRRQSWKVQYHYRFVIGNPAAQHNPERPYRIPLQINSSRRISQGFHGAKTHNTPSSQYAVDIPMPTGTKIYAARKGVVVDAAEDFFTGGADKKYLSRANFVRILHKDGSMAIYAHLELETLKVYPGMNIKRGQYIAKSGDTGYSSGPHLHFAILVNQNFKTISVPFQFSGRDGASFTPKAGDLITAY